MIVTKYEITCEVCSDVTVAYHSASSAFDFCEGPSDEEELIVDGVSYGMFPINHRNRYNQNFTVVVTENVEIGV